MLFPPSFLDRVRSHFLLSELIGRSVPLRRHGREFIGLCPFHNEKTPSFTVNDEKGFYHCFGCGAHGDAIGFLKDHGGLSYREAVEKLAGDAGISLPVMTPAERAKIQKQASLIDVMEAAAQWFEAQLVHPSARHVMAYLAERALSGEIVERFRIGFAPPSRDGLKSALMKQNITEAQLVEAGLLIVPDNGASYDRFRARIMFPIRDRSGHVIAFGGRILGAMTENSGPKYLNSPETPLFKKGEVLYNYDLARKPAMEAQQVLVAEGYMDVIALAQAGIFNAVAPLGTAVTSLQLQALWRLSPEPVLCLDGDEAGKRAMLRAAELALALLMPGKSLKFALLPKGEDPDTMVRRHGPAAMRELLQQARPLSQILYDQAASSANATPEGKAAAEHALMQLADKIADHTVRNYYRSFFREKLWQDRASRPGKKEQAVRSAVAPAQLLPGQALLRFEQQIVKLLLLYPALLHESAVEEELARMECHDRPLDMIRQALVEFAGIADTAAALIDWQGQLEPWGLWPSVEAVLNDTSIPLPRSLQATETQPEERLREARDIWQRLHAAYALARMQTDYRQQALSVDGSEDAKQRCVELQRQIRDMQRNQFQPLEVAGGE